MKAAYSFVCTLPISGCDFINPQAYPKPSAMARVANKSGAARVTVRSLGHDLAKKGTVLAKKAATAIIRAMALQGVKRVPKIVVRIIANSKI